MLLAQAHAVLDAALLPPEICRLCPVVGLLCMHACL